MPQQSKKVSAPSAKAGKTKKDKTLVVVQCEAHKGKTPCLQRAMAAEILSEALASTVWNHRDDEAKKVEFVVSESGIVQSGRAPGHFEIGVSVTRLDSDVYDKNTVMHMSLHKFLQTFIPTRTISVQDCHS